MCAVCRSRSGKRELVRVARLASGEIEIDPTGKGPGRGAYLCRSRACFSNPEMARQLGRALRATLPSEALAALAEFAAGLPEGGGDANNSS